MARLNCTFKWKDKSVHLDEIDVIVYLDGKSKVYDLNCKTNVYV